MFSNGKFPRWIWPALLALILSGCTGNPIPVEATLASPPLPATPVATRTASPTASPCDPTIPSLPQHYGVTLEGAQVEMLWHSIFVPWWVRSSPDGRVLAVGDGGDSIYELKPDGTLGIAYRCAGVKMETFAAASDGALWFATRDGGRLYRVAPDGTVRILAQNGNRNLEAGPDGSVYAMENGLVRIDPSGTIKTITSQVQGRKFAIGPNGEITALTDGNVVQVSEDGEISVLGTGYGPEPWLTFGPDGLLYVTHWSSIDIFDLVSGSVSTIPWMKNRNISEAGTFAPDGRLLIYHPNTNVFAVNLETQTVDLYFQVTSNSWAMAANPGDAIYVAYGNTLPGGETRIFRVANGEMTGPVASVPYGIERSMVFDQSGAGYLGVGDSQKGGAIYRFDPLSGQVELFRETACFPASLSVDPVSGSLWWASCGHFESLDGKGTLLTMPGVDGAESSLLAISSAGEFYAIAFFRRASANENSRHGLYRYDQSTGTWVEVADLTMDDPGITLALPVACPDGRIYTVEGVDGAHLPSSRPSWNAVRRLEADGSLTVLGYDFSYDGLSASCDSASGKLIFTSGAGIFALTLP